MDLNYSQEELAFRDEVRSWLAANLPPALKEKVARYAHLSKEEVMGWHRILAAKGWVAPSWPLEWGGTGWNPVQRFIFEEECGYAGAPPLPALSLLMCAPVLIHYGTPEQKQRFLPRIYSGEDFWCQGYSEPGAGSDLASLKTRAELVRSSDGDHYLVNGQKTWTTQAQWANWMFCLVRSDPAAAKPQEGISFLLIDMNSPGVTVRPLMLMDGSHEVNEVFLDDVRVPVENLVHEEGRGWTVAKFLLGYERLNSGRIAPSKRQLARLRALAAEVQDDGVALLDDPRFRDQLTRVEVELMALEITNLRFIDEMRRTGRPPGPEVSILKLKGTAIQQALSELMLKVAGPLAHREMAGSDKASGEEEAAALLAAITSRYLNLRKVTIYGGSDEVQRNILAKMSLGL
ncbi:acyl-CoA dehydrogenase family protein [Lacisediminimonas profundi]|uniref:acyl-CoA dehydrogenase family protein n=1 Tax=Lacisediminimonas profundi TaxID=2603856 RepID=UPI00124B2EA7|nr:acyl-CoA dehydrogenase family protein [Lacisediminimonas profundi]